MLRRLLTCLAVFTGLTAIAAPAQAEDARSLVSQLEASLGDTPECKSEDRVCECRERAKDEKKSTEEKDCPRQKRRVIYLPPIFLGPDRSLE